MLSDSHGELLSRGLSWAVWIDGRVKFTTGGAADPYSRRADSPRHHRPALLGVLPPQAHLALVTRRGKVLRIDPATVNPQGLPATAWPAFVWPRSVTR